MKKNRKPKNIFVTNNKEFTTLENNKAMGYG